MEDAHQRNAGHSLPSHDRSCSSRETVGAGACALVIGSHRLIAPPPQMLLAWPQVWLVPFSFLREAVG